MRTGRDGGDLPPGRLRTYLGIAPGVPAGAFLAARGISEPAEAAVVVVGLAGMPADENVGRPGQDRNDVAVTPRREAMPPRDSYNERRSV